MMKKICRHYFEYEQGVITYVSQWALEDVLYEDEHDVVRECEFDLSAEEQAFLNVVKCNDQIGMQAMIDKGLICSDDFRRLLICYTCWTQDLNLLKYLEKQNVVTESDFHKQHEECADQSDFDDPSTLYSTDILLYMLQKTTFRNHMEEKIEEALDWRETVKFEYYARLRKVIPDEQELIKQKKLQDVLFGKISRIYTSQGMPGSDTTFDPSTPLTIEDMVRMISEIYDAPGMPGSGIPWNVIQDKSFKELLELE
jgi:hypothetical protein